MNQFVPISWALRNRIKETRYEDVEEFKALLALERLILQPLRNWRDEALFVGLKDRFPGETEFLTWQLHSGGTELDNQTARGLLRTRCELMRLREKRRIERRDFYRRERAEWFAAGGLP
jgi:hypothetical protein